MKSKIFKILLNPLNKKNFLTRPSYIKFTKSEAFRAILHLYWPPINLKENQPLKVNSSVHFISLEVSMCNNNFSLPNSYYVLENISGRVSTS